MNGVAWYRKKLDIPQSDKGKSIFLDMEGAMSYTMVWINGYLAGGWPYGYNSFRIDLTPYLVRGGENQLAIRIDNPNHSARWYPGAGIYRNVWLVKTSPVHVSQWGTFLSTDMIPFPSHQRNAFNGLALAIVRSKQGEKGNITVHAVSDGIKGATVKVTCE